MHHIAIIGGSFAGVSAARTLATSHSPHTPYTVTLIESRQVFYYNCGAPRALVQPNSIPTLQIPYDGIFANPDIGAVRVGVSVSKVTLFESMEGGLVHLADGTEIPFSRLLVATGASFPSPWKSFSTEPSSIASTLASFSTEVAQASRILVVGGGAVGVEAAGEIATDHPAKLVHLVHSGAELMHTTEFVTTKFRALLLEKLRGLGVIVHLGQRANLPTGIDFSTTAYIVGERTLALASGDAITVDLIVFCTGAPPNPSTTFLPPSLLNSSRLVDVDKSLRSHHNPTVFAAGDCTSLTEYPRLAFVAGFQGVRAAHNIIQSLTPSYASASPPTPLPRFLGAGNFIVVTTGRRGGVAHIPGIGVVGDNVVHLLKSRDIMISKAWHDLGLAPPPGLEPASTAGSWLDCIVNVGDDLAKWSMGKFWYKAPELG